MRRQALLGYFSACFLKYFGGMKESCLANEAQVELAQREAVSMSKPHSLKVTSSVQFISLNLTVFSNWCSSAVYKEEDVVYVCVCLSVSRWVDGVVLAVKWDKGVKNQAV